MPLIDNQMRTPSWPRAHRPHLILCAGLLLLLAVLSQIGG